MFFCETVLLLFPFVSGPREAVVCSVTTAELPGRVSPRGPPFTTGLQALFAVAVGYFLVVPG